MHLNVTSNPIQTRKFLTKTIRNHPISLSASIFFAFPPFHLSTDRKRRIFNVFQLYDGKTFFFASIEVVEGFFIPMVMIHTRMISPLWNIFIFPQPPRLVLIPASCLRRPGRTFKNENYRRAETRHATRSFVYTRTERNTSRTWLVCSCDFVKVAVTLDDWYSSCRLRRGVGRRWRGRSCRRRSWMEPVPLVYLNGEHRLRYAPLCRGQKRSSRLSLKPAILYCCIIIIIQHGIHSRTVLSLLELSDVSMHAPHKPLYIHAVKKTTFFFYNFELIVQDVL